MADSKSPEELLKSLTSDIEGRQAIEQAVQKGLQTFIETANAEITKLQKSNTVGPDVSAEMLELQKSVIDMTIKAIQSGPLGSSEKK